MPSTHEISRRRLLALAATTGAGALAATALSPIASASSLFAAESFELPEIGTPDEALAELERGNRRFVENRVVGPNRNMVRLQSTAPKQTPFAAFLSCADSRVPVEIIFDQGFGDLFVCRAAGNVVSPEMIASLEFGTLVLGSKVLVVLGHSACGAVAAAQKGDAVPGQISTLYHRIEPALESGMSLDAAVTANVRYQARLLERSSPVLAGLVKEGKLRIVGATYALATGKVTMLPAKARA
jgi:carbonic anhydrase